MRPISAVTQTSQILRGLSMLSSTPPAPARSKETIVLCRVKFTPHNPASCCGGANLDCTLLCALRASGPMLGVCAWCQAASEHG